MNNVKYVKVSNKKLAVVRINPRVRYNPIGSKPFVRVADFQMAAAGFVRLSKLSSAQKRRALRGEQL
jgi:hypothetical protein